MRTEICVFWDFAQRRVVVIYRRFVTTYRPNLQGSAVQNYHYMLRKIRKESRRHWHCDGSLNRHWWCNLLTVVTHSPSQSRTMVSSSVQAGLAACEWKETGIAVVCIVVLHWAGWDGEKMTRIAVVCIVALHWAGWDGDKSEGNFLLVLPVSERRKVLMPCLFVLMLRVTCTGWDPVCLSLCYE
jgi:hypothetical protein